MLGILLAMMCLGLAVLFLVGHQAGAAIVLAVVAILVAGATGWRFRTHGDDL